MEFFTLYLIIMVSGLSPLFGVPGGIMILGGISLAVPMIFISMTNMPNDGERQYLNMCKWLVPTLFGVGFLFCTIAAFIPSWEQMKFLIGGYYITNIDGIESIPANMVDMINGFITEMKPTVLE